MRLRKPGFVQRYFREADVVGRVHLLRLSQGRRSGQPARVPAHHLNDGDGRSRAHGLGVLSRAHGGKGHEAGRAAIAGSVVGAHQVVVYCLGYMYGSYPGICRDPVGGLRRVVPSNGEQVLNAVAVQGIQHPGQVLGTEAAASGPQGRSRGIGDAGPGVMGLPAQVDQVAGEDSIKAMDGAVDVAEGVALVQDLLDQARQALIHDRGAAPRLEHQYVFAHTHFNSISG